MILINKPIGITSNSIVKKISYIFTKKKIGYCGNLDTFASGVLLIIFEEYKLISKYINNSNKEYISILKFGYKSESSDINGNYISSNIETNIKKNNILYNIYKAQGYSYQIPHTFSSVKYKGKNLYEYTKYGIKLKKKKKYIYLNKIKTLKIKKNITLKISCTKGTYIRSLVDYIGKKLNCKSHVTLLHRTNIGIFNIKKTIKLENTLYIRHKNIKKIYI